MKFTFIDDSTQRKPTRAKCGELVAVGGIIVSDDKIRPFEEAVNGVCKEFGFPEGELLDFRGC